MPTFPDFPGHRFMYDQDGTIVQTSPMGATSPLTVIDGMLINDESPATLVSWFVVANSYKEIVFAFPEARDLTGIFVVAPSTSITGPTLYYSTDTTDGSNGTWVSYGNITKETAIGSAFRSSIQALTGLLGIKGIRLRFSHGNVTAGASVGATAIHLYGDISTLANPDRLEFWESVQDVKLGPMGLDFGDLKAGETGIKTFRLKNLSTTKTAYTILVVKNNTPNTASGVNDLMLNGLQFSLNNGPWENSVTVGSIPPNNYSVPIRIRRVVGASEPAQPSVIRVAAIPTSFAA